MIGEYSVEEDHKTYNMELCGTESIPDRHWGGIVVRLVQ